MFKPIARSLSACLAILLLVLAVPVDAVTQSEVTGFLEDHYPRLTGTIISQRNNRYYARVEANLTESRVQIVRESIQGPDHSRQLVETVVGTGRITDAEGETSPLSLSSRMKQNVRLGDRLRLPEAPLVIRNRSDMDTETLINTVRDLPFLATVQPDAGSEGDEGYLLEVRTDSLSLHERATMNQLARRTTKTVPSEDQERADPVQRVHRFDRKIHDAELVGLPGQNRARLLLFAGNRSLGLTRYDTGVTRVSWETVPGKILDVSTGKPSGNKPVLPVTLVSKDRGKIRTRHYELNLNSRSLNHLWTVSDYWIHGGKARYYRQALGISRPFEHGLTKVSVSRDGQQAASTPKHLTDLAVSSPAYNVHDETVFAVNKTGRFDVYSDGERVAGTSERYGGSPQVVDALRGEGKQNLNPEFTSWKQEKGYRVLLPHNVTSGITAFRGLTYYRTSRMYLLDVEEAAIDRLWESDRLTGYVSSVTKSRDLNLITLVDNENDVTRLYRVNPSRIN